MSDYRVLANRRLSGPIEREELDGDEVRYKNMALIDRGVWTDSGSGQPTEYDPQELEVAEDNAVNIMHDADSEASQAGYIKADSYHVEDDTGYATVVLDLSTSAGQYADETLQETLESGGEVGFGGPSIEIPAEGYDLEQTEAGHPKLVNGTIEGLGFVRDPASKSTSFARQTAERGVAMSAADSPNAKVFLKQDTGMSGELDLAAIREQYNLSDDVDEATVKELAEAGALSLEDKEDPCWEGYTMVGTDEEGNPRCVPDDDIPDATGFENAATMDAPDAPRPEDADKEGDDEPPEAEEQEMAEEMTNEEMMSAIQALRERMADLEEREEQLESEMGVMKSDYEDKDKEMSELRNELAEVETVEALQEAKDDLEKRLSAVEDEPKNPKSLSDDGDDTDDTEYSPISPSQSRGY